MEPFLAKIARMAIQTAINTANDHRTTIVIPGNNYYVSSTITFPNQEGRTVLGAGATTIENENSTNNGPASKLIWTGGNDGPILDIDGRAVHFIGSLSVQGKSNSEVEANQASIGIRFKKESIGIGTGKHSFDYLAITDCDTAIQVGRTEGEGNNDNLYFKYLVAVRCGTVYDLVNEQGIGHNIDFLYALHTDVIVRARAGGNFYAKSGLIASSGTTMFYVANGDTGPNSNKGQFIFEKFKVDSQATTFTPVRAEKSNTNTIIFRDIHTKNDNYDGSQMFRVVGSHKILIDGWLNFPSGVAYLSGTQTGGFDRYPYMCVRNSELTFASGSAIVHDGLSNGYTLKTRDCFGPSGRPRVDFDVIETGSI